MRALTAIFSVALVLVYPLAVYVALTRWSARAVGLLVLAFMVPRALLAARGARREHLLHALRVPLTVGLLGALSALAGDARFVLVTPALINVALFANFALSLRGEMPIVERFARMQVDHLSDAERVWCRQVTVAWCAFFVFNATTATVLALAAPLSWWAFFTGVLDYVLIGLMFGVEYVVRSYRFRHYGTAPHDRVMAWLLPPRPEAQSPQPGVHG